MNEILLSRALNNSEEVEYNPLILLASRLKDEGKAVIYLEDETNLHKTYHLINVLKNMEVPFFRFIHLPKILDYKTEQPLNFNKFNNFTIEAFREKGYTAEALVNLACLMGIRFNEEMPLAVPKEV